MFTEQSDGWLVIGHPPTPNLQGRIELRSMSTGELYALTRGEARLLADMLRKVDHMLARKD
jgi:hypothetical protein